MKMALMKEVSMMVGKRQKKKWRGIAEKKVKEEGRTEGNGNALGTAKGWDGLR